MQFQQNIPPWAKEQASAGSHTKQFKETSSSVQTKSSGHTTTTVKTTTYRQEVQVIFTFTLKTQRMKNSSVKPCIFDPDFIP